MINLIINYVCRDYSERANINVMDKSVDSIIKEQTDKYTVLAFWKLAKQMTLSNNTEETKHLGIELVNICEDKIVELSK